LSHEHPLRPRIRRRRARPARRPAGSYDLTAQAGDLAADHPDRVQRLVVSEAFLPGITPPYPLLVPAARNEKLWHIAFNRCAEVNERLVRGREDVFLGIEHEPRL
jgi:pimeloyl-ACP methyl ester carboxylesterase